MSRRSRRIAATSRAPAPQPVRGCTSSSRSVSTFPTALSSAPGAGLLALVEVSTYENLADLFEQHPEAAADCWLATTKAPQDYCEAEFHDGCWLFFGKETAGLPEDFRLAHYERCIRLPMRAEARSLNLSNSVAILTYEALKQLGFPGLKGTGEIAEQPD